MFYNNLTEIISLIRGFLKKSFSYYFISMNIFNFMLNIFL